MLNMVKADLFKMYKSPAIKILAGITIMSSIIMTVMAYLIPLGKISQSYTGIGFLLSDIDVMSILGGVAAGIFICGDFDNKVVHDAIASGSSRGTIVLGKAMSFFCAIIIMMLPYAVVTLIGLFSGIEFSMGNTAVGFLYMLTTESGKLDASEIFKLIVLILTQMVVYLGQLSLCLPFAFVFKKPVAVVAGYYGFTILCANLGPLRAASKAFDELTALTPFGGNYTFLNLEMGAGDIFKAVIVSVVFAAIMIIITWWPFRKAEIR